VSVLKAALWATFDMLAPVAAVLVIVALVVTWPKVMGALFLFGLLAMSWWDHYDDRRRQFIRGAERRNTAPPRDEREDDHADGGL
jgi:hypothetical protein